MILTEANVDVYHVGALSIDATLILRMSGCNSVLFQSELFLSLLG